LVVVVEATVDVVVGGGALVVVVLSAEPVPEHADKKTAKPTTRRLAVI
jgi:hypothetical protein